MRVGIVAALFVAFPSALRAADVDYTRDIKPLLFNKCAACHGVLKQQAGLRLDAGQLIHKGSESGPILKPGDSAGSELFKRVGATDGAARMPPEGEGEHLTAAQLALLKAWIDQGAKFPSDEKIPEDPAQHWSYRPMARPAVPVVKNTAWVRNPIDAFIAFEHEKHGLKPAAEAPREMWLRRVYLDLIGLPPTRGELHAFLADTSEGAYERVVDDLLQRPQYGERWGRHWMDVWRYSDWYGSRGINEIRYSQRHIWRWRDWIVESLNEDKPYDRMVTEMLAGDELAPTDPQVLRATGFLGRNWYKFDRNVWMFETIEQTSQAFLGVTMRCCRCHDHKFDPITQEEYYRFRAFFEPHDVRTDALAAGAATEKDATLGMVLKEGVARIYDKDLAVKTFVFQRGDNRYPDEKRPVTPGVPASLLAPMKSAPVEVQAVTLPAEAYYPMLRPEMAQGLLTQADATIKTAQENVQKAREAVAAASRKIDELAGKIARGEASPSGKPPTIHDDFATRKDDVWKIASGGWAWENGKLVEKTVGSFATIVSTASHPRDFQARVRYRTLKEGTYRSVGFSFDQNGPGDSQDVYTSVNDNAPTVQAFHRKGGKQEYPAAGIVPTPLKIGEEIAVDVTVRGQQLAITVNGTKKLDYVMPVPRRDGKFALWVHNGAAEFLEVDVRELAQTLDDLRREQTAAEQAVAVAERKVRIAEAERASVAARIDAERAKYGNQPVDTVQRLATQASRAEKHALVVKAEETVLTAEQHRDTTLATLYGAGVAIAEGPAPPPAQAEAEKKLNEANAALAAAIAARDKPDGKYAPLGEVFPATSSGRRLALARWIADPKNPRTARVAANHIWLRHFGQALVLTVANFGLNGDRPTHPGLLDWLAAELVGEGQGSSVEGPGTEGKSAWRMKRLHRLMVLSATYRQSSIADFGLRIADSKTEESNPHPTSTSSNPQSAIRNPQSPDPTNRYLAHANSRRMEAEAVRDAVLSTAGTLDLTRGGPEIAESEGQSVLRRSLYFRNTPNEKMKFLELFDVANPNECYRRKESVVPQQALALMNSSLALDSARTLAENLSRPLAGRDDDEARTEFITAAFETVLTRKPTEKELATCRKFLEQNATAVQATNQPPFPAGNQTSRRAPSPKPHLRARENLVHVLFSHNDFVTVR